jgi:hypothetical protein
MVSIYDESVLLIVFMKKVVLKNPPSYLSHKLPFLCFGEGVVCIFYVNLILVSFVQLFQFIKKQLVLVL